METTFSARSGRPSLLICLAALPALCACPASAQVHPLAVSTIAGLANFGGADGIGSRAKFLMPTGVAADSAGNVYVADPPNDTIRKISAAGIVTTLAGSPQISGTNDGTGSAALFNQPYGVAVDAAGNVYVADTYNSTIREVTTNGVVTTVAGRPGVAGYLDGGASIAAFAYPFGIAVDAQSNIYVADSYDNLIRKISHGVVTTVAGDNNTTDIANGANFGSANGTNFSAKFNTPYAVAVDNQDNLYVADSSNNLVRLITPSEGNWIVTTLVGNTNLAGTANGSGTNAEFNFPTGIAVDRSRNIYLADEGNELIRLVHFTNGAWSASTLAGATNSQGHGEAGDSDGFSLDARFYGPWGVAADSAGNVYVGDAFDGNVRQIAPDTNANLVVSTLAGPDQSFGLVDSTNGAAAARFTRPGAVALDAAGNIYVADTLNNCIRQITPAGSVTTLAGSEATLSGASDGTNTQASFNNPNGLCVDVNTNIYVADYGNSTIREITPVFTGQLTNWITATIAGRATNAGYLDTNVATNALFNGPSSVAVDNAGNVYVADSGNNVIRLITNGGVATLAGATNGMAGFGDGSNSLFNDPTAIAWDGTTSNLYVIDSSNISVRQIAPGGMVTTPLPGRISGKPGGIAVDPSGNVYIADSGGDTILGVPPGLSPAALTNLAGTDGKAGSADGLDTAARFDSPGGLAVDASGNVYVADIMNDTIRKGTPVAAGQGVLTADTSPSGFGLSINGTNYSTPQTLVLTLNSSVTALTPSNNLSATGRASNSLVFIEWTSNGVPVSSATNYPFTIAGNVALVANYATPFVTVSSTPSLAFGVVPIHSSSNLTLTISNLGNILLDVTNINGPAGLAVSPTNFAVAPGSNESVTVTFSPLATTNYAGTLQLVSDATGGATNIPVSGFGDATNTSTFVLTVLTNGLGTVKPINAGTRLFKANQTITLTATASAGNLFSNWTGSLTTNKNPLTIVMNSDKVIEANFVTNIFLSSKGQYNGLFWNTNGQIDEETAGMLKGLTVGPKGTYSGTLMVNGAGHGFGGTFGVNGQATNKIPRPASQGGPLELGLTLLTPLTSSSAIPSVTGIIQGSNSAGQAFQSTVLADLASNIPSPVSAEYTATVPPDVITTNVVPQGDGYAVITNNKGTVKITGALADGTTFSESAPAAQTGDVPLYANLYANKGLLIGWLNLDPTNTSGPVYWVHPPNVRGSLFASFVSTNLLNVSLWSNPPAAGVLPTNLTVIEYNGGAPTATNSFSLTVSNNYRLGGAGPEPFSGAINPKTGLLTVTVGSGASKQTGYGVVLPETDASGGYFVTKTNAGAILLKP